MWVELLFVLALDRYHNIDVVGEYSRYFLLIPQAFFSVEILLHNAYNLMAEQNGDDQWLNDQRSHRMSSHKMSFWIMSTFVKWKFYELIFCRAQQLWADGIGAHKSYWNESQIIATGFQHYCKSSHRTPSMGPTWGPPGSCRPHMGPMLAPRTLLLGSVPVHLDLNWGCLFFKRVSHTWLYDRVSG